jgi:hypothetical protein
MSMSMSGGILQSDTVTSTVDSRGLRLAFRSTYLRKIHMKVPDSEHLAQRVSGERDKIGFSISSGGYFLETNGGGASGSPGSSVDPTIAAYRANAAAAQYSRVVAAEMYGEHRA